jgi:hypothetical protein
MMKDLGLAAVLSSCASSPWEEEMEGEGVGEGWQVCLSRGLQAWVEIQAWVKQQVLTHQQKQPDWRRWASAMG